MNLSMAIGVEQDAIIHVVWPPQGSPDDVMVVPSRDLCDLLLANGTDPLLLFPEVQQFPSSLQIVSHPDPQALLKVDFAFRIVGVGVSFNLGMPFDGERGRVE